MKQQTLFSNHRSSVIRDIAKTDTSGYNAALQPL